MPGPARLWPLWSVGPCPASSGARSPVRTTRPTRTRPVRARAVDRAVRYGWRLRVVARGLRAAGGGAGLRRSVVWVIRVTPT